MSEPVAYVDVFVDDFIAVAQGNNHRLRTVRRLLMHAVDEVLQAPTSEDDKFKEPLSLSKLVKDGSWTTTQVLLGWLVDAVRKTIELPPHRKERLLQVFKNLHGQQRVSKKAWQGLLGELRFASIGIPGSKGLFCILQLGLSKADKGRVRVTPAIRAHLASFERLVRDLTSRPTRLGEIIPDQPCLAGAHDASGIGMGGVYFSETKAPAVWRFPYPDWVRDHLVSFDNPKGDLTNSDLEQAGGLAQMDVMALDFDIRELTVANLTDNTPTLSRNFKGATTTDGSAAYLCQLAAEHQRQHRYLNEMAFIPGDRNDMADDASRLCHLSDSAFLTHMNVTFPQDEPWRLLQLATPMWTSLASALRRKPSTLLLPQKPGQTRPRHLNTGPHGVKTKASSTPSKGSNSIPSRNTPSPTVGSTGGDYSHTRVARNFEDLLQFLVSSVPLARRSPTWWTRTPSLIATNNDGPKRSGTCSVDLPEEILHRGASGQPPWTCSSTSTKWALPPDGPSPSGMCYESSA